MTLKVFPGRYFARLFFVPITSGDGDGDVLGAVYRDEGSNAWQFWYRFRWYRDDKGFESQDEKTFYEGTGSSDLADTLSGMRTALDCLITRGPFEEIIVDSADTHVVMARLKEQPWVSVKKGEPRS